MSDIKAQIAFHQAWLQVEAPQVAEAYDDLVLAAQEEGGIQMQQAWKEPLRDTDATMNLGVAYGRSKSDAARARTLDHMRQEIRFPGGCLDGTRDEREFEPCSNPVEKGEPADTALMMSPGDLRAVAV
jgi:hypothetical protein